MGFKLRLKQSFNSIKNGKNRSTRKKSYIELSQAILSCSKIELKPTFGLTSIRIPLSDIDGIRIKRIPWYIG
jgi:hypothetical protein